MTGERQLTFAPHGHILTNAAVWSPDSRRIVYDVRSDPAGTIFDGDRIETVDVESGAIRVLFQVTRGAKCGVATYHPSANRVVFILGPDEPTLDWQYGPTHRRGVIVDEANPGVIQSLDACNLVPPFTPGALRGGSHVHTFSPDGRLVAFTYEDHILAVGSGELNQRNVGVCIVDHPVRVSRGHPRNHDGSAFSVLVTRTRDRPRPGSDEISRAYEDAWIDSRRIAFLGDVIDGDGRTKTELFVVELPNDLTREGDGPLAGTATTRPRPPRGTVQRRLTFTNGLTGPRFWPRSHGGRIAFLMRDVGGVVQLWWVSAEGGSPHQLSFNDSGIGSAFTWTPNGESIVYVCDGSIHSTNTTNGATRRLATTTARPEACVVSPDGQWVAFVRPVEGAGGRFNQVFMASRKGGRE